MVIEENFFVLILKYLWLQVSNLVSMVRGWEIAYPILVIISNLRYAHDTTLWQKVKRN